jgi:hypothetical protein
MSPPRKQPSHEEPQEEFIFPDLEGMETSLDQISRTQERISEAVSLSHDRLSEKLDRVEKELRTEHGVIMEKTNTLVTNQAVIMDRMNIPKSMQQAQPGNTNIIIKQTEEKENGKGFFGSFNSNTALKIGFAALMLAVAVWMIASVGAKIISVKSGDNEATITFDNNKKAAPDTK